MAKLTPKRIILENINNGNEYVNGNGITPDTFNIPVQASAYAQNFSEAMADSPDLSEIGNVGNPSVELIDNVKDGVTYKKLKFKNLKGETGEKGEKGDKGETGSIADVDTELSPTSENPLQNKVIAAELGKKVDKETGKGLSTNDFTAAYKAEVDKVVNKADLTASNLTAENVTQWQEKLKSSEEKIIFDGSYPFDQSWLLLQNEPATADDVFEIYAVDSMGAELFSVVSNVSTQCLCLGSTIVESRNSIHTGTFYFENRTNGLSINGTFVQRLVGSSWSNLSASFKRIVKRTYKNRE